DFFLEDAGIWCHIGKDGWLQEVAFWEFFWAFATGDQTGFILPNLDIGPDFVEVLWVDQGANFGLRVVWHPDFDVGGLGCVAFDEFVVDAALDQDAGAGGAAFTVEGEHTEDGRVDGFFDVCVFEDDGWGFAAQLHGQALEVWGSVGHDDLAGAGFTGERDQWDIWVFDQRVTGVAFFAVTVDHVEHTCWQAGFFKDAWPQACRQRSELGWFQDNGVSGCKCWTKFPGFQHERGVPRGD